MKNSSIADESSATQRRCHEKISWLHKKLNTPEIFTFACNSFIDFIISFLVFQRIRLTHKRSAITSIL